MKTTETAVYTAVHANNIDDIIFESRNQSYGAYSLRRNYNNRLSLSLLIVISIALIVVAYLFMYTKMNPVIEKTPIGISITIDPAIVTFQPELPEPPAKKVVAAPAQSNSSADGPIIIDDNIEENTLLTTEEIIDQIGSIDIPAAIPISLPAPKTPDKEDINITFSKDDVSTQALFLGGTVDNFRKWLSKNIRYPEDAISSDVKGTVVLKFTIDKSGKICDISVLRGIHPAVDEAVIKALSQSPKWTAATIEGKPVRVSYFLPIAFCILK